jgi:hypothetical protein
MTVAELLKELEHKPPGYKVIKAGTTTEIHEVVTDHKNQQVKIY